MLGSSTILPAVVATRANYRQIACSSTPRQRPSLTTGSLPVALPSPPQLPARADGANQSASSPTTLSHPASSTTWINRPASSHSRCTLAASSTGQTTYRRQCSATDAVCQQSRLPRSLNRLPATPRDLSILTAAAGGYTMLPAGRADQRILVPVQPAD